MRSAPSDIDETRRPNSRASARVRNAESEGGPGGGEGWPAKSERVATEGVEEREKERRKERARGGREQRGVAGAQ